MTASQQRNEQKMQEMEEMQEIGFSPLLFITADPS
jgi:hypothetical protein